MPHCRFRLLALSLMFFSLFATALRAADSPPSAKVEPVAGGLDNPTSLALRPGTNEWFVSESGAGRIVRIAPGAKAAAVPMVTGFPVAPYPAMSNLRLGPLGLAFLDKLTLVCGAGGEKPDDNVLRIIKLSSGDKPVTADQARQQLAVIPGDKDPRPAEGWYWGVAVVPDRETLIFAGSLANNKSGWVCRSFMAGEVASQPSRLADCEALAHVGAPMAVATSPRGELLVGEAGQLDNARDSHLLFLNPKNGKLLLSLPANLYDLVDLAYSPQTGLLYGVDLAWAEPREGGLFRLDAGQQDGHNSIKAVKIAALDRPTALAFAPDGTLYITLLGPAKSGGGEKTGQVVKIAPGL
jgi:hypothetical protein